MALKRLWYPSPNYSSRGGARVDLAVIHNTEGTTSIESLGGFFGSSSAGVSSHAGSDNHRQGTIGEYVKRGNKAWTQGNANPVCVSIEQCTPAGASAGWSRAYWLDNQEWMLRNTAAWVAEECAAFGIPLVALSASQSQGGWRGVTQHSLLGTWGGNHSDCGPGFPMDKIIEWAGGQASTPPPPTGGPGQPAPDFPYPSGHYLGQPDPDPCCHSGYYGQPDNGNVRTWQARMAERGWSIAVDGYYGSGSDSTCRQFQADKALTVDGLVGPQTWRQTWEAPVT